MTFYQRSTWMALLVVGLAATPAMAAPDPLAQAEAAYTRIEFPDAQKFARAALAKGGYDRAQMIRIYFLIGVSAAADGKDDEAIEAFRRLLTIDPDSKLDRGLSPKLQGPIMEARGMTPKPIGVDAVFNRSKGTLQLAVRDELALGRTLVIRSRTTATGAFVESRAAAAATVVATLPGAVGAPRVEYSYVLADDRGNRVFEKGSDMNPEVAEVTAVAATPSASSIDKRMPTKFLVVGIVGEVLGLAAIGGGGGAYAIGKSAADRWNNDSICLANGMSREANCASDRTKARNGQNGAIGAFVVGGALVLASTILLIAAPRTERQRVASARRFGCDTSGPGLVGIACGGQF